MPEASPSPSIGLYRSGVTSPERLRQTSVGRKHLLDNTLESVRGSLIRSSKHHMLFIGPRGIGKTHLLSHIEDAIQSNESLNAHAVVVRFPEESNQILSFTDFLIGLCGILKDVLQDEPIWTELFAAVETDEDNCRVNDVLVPAIREQNRQHGRTLVIMLENLGEIFTRQIRNQSDIASLRKFLIARNGCLLLATTPLHFQGITDIEQPFYDFFDVQILESLTFDETVEVIRRNLEWDGRASILDTLNEMRPRLRALHRMTDGNPRLTMMLYELIAHESVTRVQDQFLLLLDRISPFYQSRLNDLPPSQRALLECLARMRDQDKTPATIAARMRMSQQETSSLLKRLSNAHYLCATENPKDKRSRLYRIREGFFDIWLAMNLSRSSRKRIPVLLEFFSLFYPSLDAREEKRRQLRAKLAEGGSADAEKTLDYLSEVGSDKERASAKFDIAKTFASLGVTDLAAQYLLEAAPLARDGVSRAVARIVTNNQSAPDYLSEIEEMIECWELHRSGQLEAFSQRVKEIGSGLTLQTFSEAKLVFLQETLEDMDDPDERIRQRLRIAILLESLARWNEAETQVQTALDEAKSLANAELVASAWSHLTLLLYQTNRIEQAEQLMRQALKSSRVNLGDGHPAVASISNNFAALLSETNRIKDAEILMRQVLDIDKAALSDRHPTLAVHLNNLATILLKDPSRFNEAERLLRQALEVGKATCEGQNPATAVHLNNLAALLRNAKRFQEAEEAMRQALAIDEAIFDDQHPALATDLNNLGTLLNDTDRPVEAASLFQRALEICEFIHATTGNRHPHHGLVKENCLKSSAKLSSD
ncbi:MAG: tetratricopeptide repeat protein [Gammaproteobacteria bacterium]|nr:tetratricopeptide repeat protein [Gammaproteobacteria bacterium]